MHLKITRCHLVFIQKITTMILATDLDGTFLGGWSLDKQVLYRMLKTQPDFKLIFVTGRGLERVIPLLNDPIIPEPDYIICDVGATVVDGHSLEPVASIQNAIEEKWPGSIEIRETLVGIDGLQYQEVPQQRRCSFFSMSHTINQLVAERVKPLGCDIIYSNQKYLDIIPAGVNKGQTLKALLKFMRVAEKEVLVAGDTLNDLSLFNCGLKGVAVGNSELQLIKAVKNKENVLKASREGAGGILEAMKHFKLGSDQLEKPNQLQKSTANHNGAMGQLLILYHRFPYENRLVDGKMLQLQPKSPNGILPTLQGLCQPPKC